MFSKSAMDDYNNQEYTDLDDLFEDLSPELLKELEEVDLAEAIQELQDLFTEVDQPATRSN